MENHAPIVIKKCHLQNNSSKIISLLATWFNCNSLCIRSWSFQSDGKIHIHPSVSLQAPLLFMNFNSTKCVSKPSEWHFCFKVFPCTCACTHLIREVRLKKKCINSTFIWLYISINITQLVMGRVRKATRMEIWHKSTIIKALTQQIRQFINNGILVRKCKQ